MYAVPPKTWPFWAVWLPLLTAALQTALLKASPPMWLACVESCALLSR